MLDSVEWGEFRLEDIFEWQTGISEINPLHLSDLYDKHSDLHPFYGQATKDNGIISFNQLTPKVLNNPYSKPTLLIHSNNQNIVYLETPFYLKDGHGATSVLQSEWLNRRSALYLIATISKNISQKFSYQNKATKIALKNTVIPLPIKNNQLALDFMENFVAELEARRNAELEAYLLATGLSDYILTEEEKAVLQVFRDSSTSESETDGKAKSSVFHKLEWREFRIGELFEINSYKKRFDANKIQILEFGNPYVVRTSLNNGIRGYINEDEQFLNEGNTISFGQDTATMFYQEKPYFTGDKIKILKSKSNKFNKLSALFFISTMGRAFNSFSWGGSSFSVEIIENQKIYIPNKNNQPDYTYMQTLISAVQKLVIKDVVQYADQKIATTQTIIGQNPAEKR